jgi:beta-glucosidase-like glycosyl hydrolase
VVSSVNTTGRPIITRSDYQVLHSNPGSFAIFAAIRLMNDDDVLPFEDEDAQNHIYVIEPGAMSSGMMGRDWHHDWHRGRAMMAPVMARIIFSLIDADGDGKLTLQEFQAAHERIFKAMDTDHDGTVTFEEIQAFIRGQGGQ